MTNIQDDVVNHLKNHLHVILETSPDNNQNFTSDISRKLGSKPFVVEFTDYNPLSYIRTTQPGSKGLPEPHTNAEIEGYVQRDIKNFQEQFKNYDLKVMILESTPGNDLTPYLNVAKQNNLVVLVLVNQAVETSKVIAFDHVESLNAKFKDYPTPDNFKNDALNRIRYMHGTDSELSSVPKNKF